MLPCNMARPLTPSSRCSHSRNPFRISALHTPVFHRSATITFQTTSPLFKKHRGYTPKNRTPGETPAARIRSKMEPGPQLRRRNLASADETFLHHNHFAPVAPQSLSMYSLLLHFSAPGASALGSARPSLRDDGR